MEDDINAAGNDVTPAFHDYLRPLLGSDVIEVAWLRGAKVAKAGVGSPLEDKTAEHRRLAVRAVRPWRTSCTTISSAAAFLGGDSQLFYLGAAGRRASGAFIVLQADWRAGLGNCSAPPRASRSAFSASGAVNPWTTTENATTAKVEMRVPPSL